jgi:fermentation-respiration switch protein FrsA (DUF1100 family)
MPVVPPTPPVHVFRICIILARDYHTVMRIVGAIVVAAVVLKLFVWWIEPRMAFFPFRGVQETPAAYGLPFSDVTIRTADGETLRGWWMAHPSPRAQVIFWHGNGGNLSLWLDAIADLRRHGFSVLAVDYRGYGASTGAPSERGLYLDADAALQVFNERLRTPGVPVIYWGRSIGSSVAAHAASRAAPDAVVLESPFPDMRTAISGNPVLMFLSLFSSYRFPTSTLLERYDGPLLVIHGDADTIIPLTAGRSVFDRARGTRKTLAVIPGANHNDLHAVNPGLYWKSIDEFLAGVQR